MVLPRTKLPCNYREFPIAQIVKKLPAMQETWDQSLGGGRSTGEGNGSLFQYSCLENSMDRSLAVYSPSGLKESDTTKQRTYLHTELGMHLLGMPSLPQKGNSVMKPRDSIPWKAACFGGPMTACGIPFTVY